MSPHPLRVLALSSDYPPALGGIATLSSQVVRYLRAEGHEVRVVCASTDGVDPMTGEPCIRLGEHIPTGECLGLREVRLAAVLKRLVPEYDPDVVWSSAWFPGAAIALSLPGLMKGRVCCFSAYASEILPNTADLKQRIKGLLGPLRRRALTRSDLVFAISSYTQERLVELGAPPQRVRVVPGGVADEWFQIPRQASRTPVLLTIARLDEHKGHDVVLRALPELVRKYPDLRWEIIGPGDDARLRRIAGEVGVTENVVFRGRVSTPELKDAISRATAFVMPSREIPGRPDLIEGFGLVFLEAAAAGVPTVGGRSGGVVDAIQDGVTGFLVDPTSPEAVGGALDRLLEDPELARRLGEAGRARAAAEFTWPTVIRRMTSFIEPQLDGLSRRRGEPGPSAEFAHESAALAGK